MPGVGGGFLYFVCFQKNSLCSISPWCSFLPCMVSVAQCPLSQTILCKVPSSWSDITLQFGVQLHLPVPMLCSLLFSKVQNNKNKFYYQLPQCLWRCLGSQFSCILMSPVEIATLSLFHWDPSHANAAVAEPFYTVCWLHSLKKQSGHWLFPPMKCNCLRWSWSSHVQLHCSFCYFSPCPYCWKCWISQTENILPTGKQLLLKEQMTGLHLRENFCCGLSENDMYLDVGLKVQWWSESGFHHFFFRQCLLHGSQKMLWNKLPCSFLCVCAFLHTNTSDCSFWLCHLLFCASSFAMNLRGVLSKIEIPLYCSWLV